MGFNDIRFALKHIVSVHGIEIYDIEGMQNELREVDNDSYTPIFVFMTDGMPTDNPSAEFRLVREKVQNNEMYVFPLGIGESADMSMLRQMLPEADVPYDFDRHYKMIKPDDYFEYLKR